MPGLSSDCRWVVGRYSDRHLQGCLLSGILTMHSSSALFQCFPVQIFNYLYDATWCAVRVIVKKVASSASLNFFEQLEMLLADQVPKYGCVFHSQANHSFVCCFLTGMVQFLYDATWCAVRVIVKKVASSASLNLFEQLEMLLADQVPKYGCVFHSQAGHRCVCCFLTGMVQFLKFLLRKPSLVPLSSNFVAMSVPGKVL